MKELLLLTALFCQSPWDVRPWDVDEPAAHTPAATSRGDPHAAAQTLRPPPESSSTASGAAAQGSRSAPARRVAHTAVVAYYFGQADHRDCVYCLALQADAARVLGVKVEWRRRPFGSTIRIKDGPVHVLKGQPWLVYFGIDGKVLEMDGYSREALMRDLGLSILKSTPRPTRKRPKASDLRSVAHYPLRGGWWWGCNSYSHMMQGEHRGQFDAAWIRSLTWAELQSLHSDSHEGRVKWRYVVRP